MAKYTYPNTPSKFISEVPSEELKISICIPCYNELDIAATINSLAACELIAGSVEIIILINESEDDTKEVAIQNLKSYEDCIGLKALCEANGIKLYPVIVTQIASKKAGVGFARRLAMDEASRRFDSIGSERGIISCLDADTTVSKNYLIEMIKFFDDNPKLSACSIAFEHDLNILDQEIKSAICDYESHLRYFINMQRLIGLPFAYQTVGSAMAVTAKSYQKLGGMNTRKAGEDFYFLHKFIKNGLVGELNTACVYPSARVSDRVPFGTGKAVGDIIKSDQNYQTYNSGSFLDIGTLIQAVPSIYKQSEDLDSSLFKLSDPLKTYLAKEKFTERVQEIRSNTTNYDTFVKRFFQWFDAFRLMKCLHYLRDIAYPNIRISDAMKHLFEKLELEWSEDKFKNLEVLRDFDKKYQS